MPVKNTEKIYLENGYYHIYNRGVNKQSIFFEEIDYKVFLSYLKDYLTEKNEVEIRLQLSQPKLPLTVRNDLLKRLSLKNYKDTISLLCFGLMPNHFHFELKQTNADSIDKFMNSFATRYSLYIKNKYKRTGPLFESRYKAVLIETDPQLLEVSKYIHNQSGKLGLPSSLKIYLGERKISWIHPEEILSFFSKENPRLTYKDFLQQPPNEEIISPLTLEESAQL